MKNLRYLVLVIFLVSFVSALDGTRVISNSEDWKDVYSTLMYGSLKGVESDFLVSTAHGPILLNGISTENDIDIISSKSRPFVFNYGSIVSSKGYRSVNEVSYDSVNLELIDELPEINNFVVVGSSYGYNSIAVAPYAVVSNSWVFFADSANIADVEQVLSSRNVNKLVIYGFVDNEVTDALSDYNPQIINTGDKFEDNTKIVDEYLKIKDATQVLLTNGEFIEKELLAGTNPVLFTGDENVPDKIRDYLLSSNIKIGVLVGNDLIGAATNIRRSAGINVMVKFARGARSASDSSVSQVEGLDLFYIPGPSYSIEVYSARYNKANSQLEVTYRSDSNVPAYLQGTITILNAEREKVGDSEVIFISPGDYKTVVYTGVTITEENVSAEIYALYGEVPTSLDRVLQGTYKINIVEILDDCDIEIKNVKYNKQKEAIYVEVKNLADVNCFVDLEIKDIVLNGAKQTIGTEGSVEINAGDKKKISIEQSLDETDLEKNSFVNLYAYYGENEDYLVHVLKGRFELLIDNFTLLTYAIAIIILLIILLLIAAYIIKRREDKYFN